MVEFIDRDINVARSKINDLESIVKTQNKNNNFSFHENLAVQKEILKLERLD